MPKVLKDDKSKESLLKTHSFTLYTWKPHLSPSKKLSSKHVRSLPLLSQMKKMQSPMVGCVVANRENNSQKKAFFEGQEIPRERGPEHLSSGDNKDVKRTGGDKGGRGSSEP